MRGSIMESHRYRTNGFEVYALVREGRDPTVVLLHGAAGNALVWLPLLPALEDRRVVLVDLPGHGESPPVEDWSLERLARNLAAAIGRDHPGGLVWVGHSWGGKVAAILGALLPERARALVLVDPSPATPVPISPEDFVARALAPEIGPWTSISAALAAARLLPHYADWSDDLRRAFERGLETRADGSVAARARREWLVAIAEAALTRDDAPTIARVTCPTLLVVADQSLFWQEGTNLAVLGGLPNVETTTLPGHHWIHWAAVALLNGRVAPWLEEVTR
jgi:pimeloyl-ACP methyl ester carboxylesterase